VEPQRFSPDPDRRVHTDPVRLRLHALAGIPLPAGATDPAATKSAASSKLARPLWILAIIALIAVLRVSREVLVPLMLGVLLALVLSGLVERLRRYRIPRGVSALVLLAAGAIFIVGAVDALCTPAQSWVASAPKVLRTIEQRVRPARAIVLRLTDIASRTSALAAGSGAAAAATPATAAAVTPWDVLTETGSALGTIVTVVVLALLLLAGGPPMLAHMSRCLGGSAHATHTLKVVEAIRVEVGRYYGTLALINLGLGVATGSAMWLLGMPNPVLWGAVAAGLNFIPYLGAAITLTVLTVVALVSFSSTTHVALVAASFLALATIEGQLIEPVFLGRRLHLNPIVVFVALWAGGWLWGIAGVVFALPVLVAVKVAAAHSENGTLLAQFLGPVRRTRDEQPSSSIVALPVVLQGRAARQVPETDALTTP
jgi:predicted PurR-regulated permease PerM